MSAPDTLCIAGVTLTSRLFLGTARYPDHRVMADAVAASGAEIVTLSMRRLSSDRKDRKSVV